MYISDKAVKCDNKILFNPVIYILIFVRLYVNEIIHRNTEKQLEMDELFNLGRLLAEGDLAEGRRGCAVTFMGLRWYEDWVLESLNNKKKSVLHALTYNT